MTTLETDPNRLLWEERGAGDSSRPWESLGTEPTGVATLTADGGLWLLPDGAEEGCALLAVHGGGFVSGSVETHRRLFGHLAKASRTATFVVDYGLVPDAVYPAQLETVTNAYRRIAADRRVALVGDSCGATLALGVALRARDQHLPAPAGLLLLSAWTDLTASGASYDAGSDPFFTREVVRSLAAGYLAGADLTAPYASPMHNELHVLPPTYLQVGGEEALRDDTFALAGQATAAPARSFSSRSQPSATASAPRLLLSFPTVSARLLGCIRVTAPCVRSGNDRRKCARSSTPRPVTPTPWSVNGRGPTPTCPTGTPPR